jgi:tetratricopeptide (TPR) repeat protein
LTREADPNRIAPLSIRVLRLSVAIDPDNALAQHRRGRAYAGLARWSEAESCYQKALASGIPASSGIHHHQGSSLFRQGRLEEAEAAFRRSIEATPAAFWSYLDLGRTLIRQNRHHDAEGVFRKGLQFESKNPWLHYHLGRVLGDRQAGEKVETLLQAALLEPKEDVFFNTIAHESLLLKASQPDHIATVQKLVDENPDAVGAVRCLAWMLSVTDQIPEATRYFYQAGRGVLQRSFGDEIRVPSKSDRGLEPSFIVIGQLKAGTTSFYDYLCGHDRILPALEKEIRFWTHYYDFGLDWYRSHFLPAPTDSGWRTGEATPHYIYHPEIASHILDLAPDMTFILIIRDPASRAYSHYNMRLRKGFETRSFEDAVDFELKEFPQFPLSMKDINWIQPSYILSSGALPYLKEWLKIVPREQLLIVQSEALFANPAEVVNQAYLRLGLPAQHLEQYANSNPGSYPALNPETKQRMDDYFRPHQDALAEFLADNFGEARNGIR